MCRSGVTETPSRSESCGIELTAAKKTTNGRRSAPPERPIVWNTLKSALVSVARHSLPGELREIGITSFQREWVSLTISFFLYAFFEQLLV